MKTTQIPVIKRIRYRLLDKVRRNIAYVWKREVAARKRLKWNRRMYKRCNKRRLPIADCRKHPYVPARGMPPTYDQQPHGVHIVAPVLMSKDVMDRAEIMGETLWRNETFGKTVWSKR